LEFLGSLGPFGALIRLMVVEISDLTPTPNKTGLIITKEMAISIIIDTPLEVKCGTFSVEPLKLNVNFL
jgi:hypothetical protein